MMNRIGGLSLAIVTLVCVMSSCSDGYVDYDTFGTISGIVVDMDTENPIQGASVTLNPSGRNIFTGYDGSFDFLELEANQYTVTAQKPGFFPNRKIVNIIAGGNVNVTIVLQKEE